jgi:mono/diheme cytochrome c family protein
VAKFGRGFGRRNLSRVVRFVEIYPDLEIVQSLIAQLGCTTSQLTLAVRPVSCISWCDSHWGRGWRIICGHVDVFIERKRWFKLASWRSTIQDYARSLAWKVFVSCAMVAWVVTTKPLLGAELTSGEGLYQRHCALCHGGRGEGTAEHYDKVLTGERSIPQLTRFIAKSMPPDEPGKLNEEEAGRVAAYIHGAFYSLEAQHNRQQPRIETARLTGRQYGNMVADLMVSFFGTPPRSSEKGLRGNYAAINANGEGKQVFSRVDSDIKFDWGTSSPKPDEIEPAEFAVSWVGSIRVPVSGEYEFIVRSPNSFKLLVNDRKTAFIDAWIKSGEQTEFRGTIPLLAGRYYPLQLYFTKAGQGTKKPEQLRNKIAPASIVLAWKPPGRSEEIIPPTYLAPVETRETLLIQTPFPPDDRSTGVERGTSVSAEWEQSTTDAAIETATYAMARLGDLCGVVEPDRQHEAVLKEFCGHFAERAFRRPLTPEQKTLYIDRQFARAPDVATALERVFLLVLKSPRFLYSELAGAPSDDYTVTSRLALTLWDSIPDDTLLKAAAEGQLRTREQIAEQARRMTADHRFENKLREFFVKWLKIDQPHELRKDKGQFPDFNDAVATDLRTSLDLFLENVLDDNQLDFRRFLSADFLYLNSRLAPLFGAPPPGDDLFHKFKVNPGERAGLLTHPYLMAVFADAKTSSPIRRGVFLARSVLGRTLRPPPEAVTPIAPDLHPDLTTRERAALQTGAQTCQTCHGLINPLGFTLERFDALGRIREVEGKRPIDATGAYESRSGENVKFNGARDLATFLVNSDEVQTALIEKLFYFSVKQPIRAYGSDVLPTLQRDFVGNGYNLRRLMAEMATVAALPRVGASETSPGTSPDKSSGKKEN